MMYRPDWRRPDADRVLRELGYIRTGFPLLALCLRGSVESRWLLRFLLVLIVCVFLYFAVVYLRAVGAL